MEIKVSDIQVRVDQSQLLRPCVICGESVEDSILGLLPCHAEHPSCQACLQSYFRSQINEGTVLLKCVCHSKAAGECKQVYAAEQVLAIILQTNNLELFRESLRVGASLHNFEGALDYVMQSQKSQQFELAIKYVRYWLNSQVETNRHLRWCPVCSKQEQHAVAPTQKRDQLCKMVDQVIYQDGYAGRLSLLGEELPDQFKVQRRLCSRRNPHHGTCEKCQYEICMRCGLPYHERSDCRHELDAAMKEYFEEDAIAAKVTNCPRCGLIVEKEEGGCNHMICAKCKYEFCWICGMHYTDTHFDANNVFGCQGLQETRPVSRCRLIWRTILHLVFVPFVLLFYPVYVITSAYYNPYNMPMRWRWLCACRRCSEDASCWATMLFHCLFYPFVLAIGLALGAVNMAVMTAPAIIWKIFVLCKMTCCWRCKCCLNRHK